MIKIQMELPWTAWKARNRSDVFGDSQVNLSTFRDSLSLHSQIRQRNVGMERTLLILYSLHSLSNLIVKPFRLFFLRRSGDYGCIQWKDCPLCPHFFKDHERNVHSQSSREWIKDERTWKSCLHQKSKYKVLWRKPSSFHSSFDTYNSPFPLRWKSESGWE